MLFRPRGRDPPQWSCRAVPLEQRELLMPRGGHAGRASRSPPPSWRGTVRGPGTGTGAAPDAEALCQVADLGGDARLVVLARVRAAPVQLGVPGDKGGM